MSLWIKNAKIATMNDAMPEASSAVVIGDFFAYVGDDAGAEAYAIIMPDVDPAALTEVFLIKSFDIVT